MSTRTVARPAPYYLVFRGDAILLLKIKLPSLRVVVYNEITTEEKASLRFAKLEALDEDRLATQQNMELLRCDFGPFEKVMWSLQLDPP